MDEDVLGQYQMRHGLKKEIARLRVAIIEATGFNDDDIDHAGGLVECVHELAKARDEQITENERLRSVNKQMLEALHEVFEMGVPEKDEKIRAAIKAGEEA